MKMKTQLKVFVLGFGLFTSLTGFAIPCDKQVLDLDFNDKTRQGFSAAELIEKIANPAPIDLTWYDQTQTKMNIKFVPKDERISIIRMVENANGKYQCWPQWLIEDNLQINGNLELHTDDGRIPLGTQWSVVLKASSLLKAKLELQLDAEAFRSFMGPNRYPTEEGFFFSVWLENGKSSGKLTKYVCLTESSDDGAGWTYVAKWGEIPKQFMSVMPIVEWYGEIIPKGDGYFGD